ncbi:VF530 family protein [Acinetobacter calcoaceticus]|uniref:VF530 family protein n=1 Tax=Acinetobacter calcoaceticus TaxID=471 RepID=UPI001D0DAD49|nr:VF530 family protein [Acinetobacter calcoaceticus]
MNASNAPLHGKKLADILDELLDYYGGFEGLNRKIEIRCFCIDPSVKSSLRFLRTTPWAREKVENLKLPTPLAIKDFFMSFCTTCCD